MWWNSGRGMKVLNLYAGIGGNRKLWTDCEVTAVEYNEKIARVYKKYYPHDNVIVADAHQFLLDNYKEYDFIWSSPPCPTHSMVRKMASKAGDYEPLFPDMTLYQEIIFLKHFALTDTRWIVENVKPYYEPLIPGILRGRHLFWSNFPIRAFGEDDTRIKHNKIAPSSIVYGRNIEDTRIDNKIKVLRNMVNPELGLHVFNCAQGKKDEKAIQVELF